MGDRIVTTQPLVVDPMPALPTDAFDLVAPRTGKSGGGRTQVLVVAFPFASFGRTNAFITAIRQLPGVAAATPRRLHGGALYLGVDYAGSAPLDDGLAGLSEFQPRVTLDGDGMISVVIEAV